MSHLLVDVSYHGFGHISQTAPVVNALVQRMPALRVTLRTIAPLSILRQRFHCEFTHIPAAFDFGMTMANAVDVLVEESAQRYRAFHQDWPAKVAHEAEVMRRLAPDLLLANIPYLSLAAAQHARLPAVALCSLDWADIYRHYCVPQGDVVLQQMCDAYNSALRFLQPQPSMTMPDFANTLRVSPIATLGHDRRAELPAAQERRVLVAMGGMAFRLPIEDWPSIAGVRWVVPSEWGVSRADVTVIDAYRMSFSDLLASCDAVLTKPGYGTFTEAACAGVPVLYVARQDWPEEPYLVAWLREHAVCAEVSRSELAAGRLSEKLQHLWASPRPPLPQASGAQEAATYLAGLLG